MPNCATISGAVFGHHIKIDTGIRSVCRAERSPAALSSRRRRRRRRDPSSLPEPAPHLSRTDRQARAGKRASNLAAGAQIGEQRMEAMRDERCGKKQHCTNCAALVRRFALVCSQKIDVEIGPLRLAVVTQTTLLHVCPEAQKSSSSCSASCSRPRQWTGSWLR